MLNFTKGSDGLLVAVYDAYHKKNSKFVFKHNESQNNQDEEDILELLKLQHGKSKARYKKSIENLSLDNNFSLLKAPNVRGNFLPFMPFNAFGERMVHYVVGQSGSGKSTLASNLSHYYNKLMNVFIVSPVKDSRYNGTFVDIDKLVEVNSSSDYELQKKQYEEAKIKLKYAKKKGHLEDDQLCQLELALNDMKPAKTKEKSYKLTATYDKLVGHGSSYWIFDDNEAEGRQGKLEFLMNHQLLTGRHSGISMCILNHQATSGMKSRNIINESHIFTLFPPMSRYVKYFLKEYLLFDQNMIKKVDELMSKKAKDVDFGYVTIYKNDRIILSENQIITY